DNTTTVVDVAAGGNTWMDRNLGATAVTTADRSTYANDAAYIAAQSASFGDLYQWGRCADGHQIRTSSTTSVNATTASPSLGNSWDGKFITEGSSPFDWLATQDDNLWQGVSGTNNPCPAGYRLPTDLELEAEMDSWGPTYQNSAGAYASPLKLPVAGYRNDSNGSLYNVGSSGRYWSSTVSGAYARNLYFSSSLAKMSSNYPASGRSVRCLKDGYVATCHDNTTTVVDVAAGGNTWMDRNLGATAVTTADRSTYANDAAYIAAQSAS
ncbi:MAG: hypothetical protein GY754_05040, partial [bacterium]|nr:hypothetical protein [bacterium]